MICINFAEEKVLKQTISQYERRNKKLVGRSIAVS